KKASRTSTPRLSEKPAPGKAGRRRRKPCDETFRRSRSSTTRRPGSAMVGGANVEARYGDRRIDCAAVWQVPTSQPAERSILVSGPRFSHGNGLAFLGYYDFGHGRSQARIARSIARAWHLYLWRPRHALAKHA